MYLSYSAYADMGGTLADADYPRAYHRAEAEFDRYTFRRFADADELPERGRWCLFELIETIGNGIKMYESDGGGVVTSSSNDGVSESYGVSSAAEWQTVVLPARIKQIVNIYMDNVPAQGINSTYRGVS